MSSSTTFVAEAMLPKFWEHCKEVNAAAWKQYEEKKNAYSRYTLDLEIAQHVQKESTDYLGMMYTTGTEEKNVWKAFQQIGPMPTITRITDIEEELIPLEHLRSEVSTPSSTSPFPSSSSDSSDSEQDNFRSGTSSDSGIESDVSGSTVKRMKKYKVFTAEEIKKRNLIVDEWKKKIRDSLLA